MHAVSHSGTQCTKYVTVSFSMANLINLVSHGLYSVILRKKSHSYLSGGGLLLKRERFPFPSRKFFSFLVLYKQPAQIR